MKLLTVGVAVLLGAMAVNARADALPNLSTLIEPGEWSFVVTPDVQIGSIKVPQNTVKHDKCVTREDLKKSWFAESKKQCTTESAHYSNHVLVYTQKCKLNGSEVTAKGRITIDSSKSYHGEIDTTGTISGQPMKGHTKLKATRTGPCSGAKD